MARHTIKTHVEWYISKEASYKALANTIAATLQTLLQNSKIDVLSISHRAKTIDSFKEKLRRKRYSDPKIQMTDLAGIRVVTLVERDIERVSEIIRSSFNVHADESLDKTLELGSDRFGYPLLLHRGLLGAGRMDADQNARYG